MKLLMSPASPFVRLTRVLIREADITGIEEVAVSTTPLATDSQVAAANPVGKIPCLVRDDGPNLYDSRVICRYLDATRAGGRFYPETRLWEVLTLEATAHGMAEAAVAMVYEARFKGTDGASGDWIEAQWGKITRALDALEARWMSHLEGPLNMGGIATGAALGYLDFRLSERNWRDGRRALSAWQARMEDRESMKRTAPRG